MPEFQKHSAWAKKHDADIDNVRTDLKKKVEKIYVPFKSNCHPDTIDKLRKDIIVEIEGLRKEIARLRNDEPPGGGGGGGGGREGAGGPGGEFGTPHRPTQIHRPDSAEDGNSPLFQQSPARAVSAPTTEDPPFA
jgi:hypothetical protein